MEYFDTGNRPMPCPSFIVNVVIKLLPGLCVICFVITTETARTVKYNDQKVQCYICQNKLHYNPTAAAGTFL